MNFKELAIKYKYVLIKLKSKDEFIYLINDFKKNTENELASNFTENTDFYLSNFNDFCPDILMRLFREYSREQKKFVYGYFLIDNKNKNFSDDFTTINYTKYIRKYKLIQINKYG